MATRRDYQLVADALNTVFTERKVDSTLEFKIAIELIATLADKFALENTRFDRQRFIDACWKGL